MEQIEEAARYLLGSDKAKELECIATMVTVHHTNHVYQAKYPDVVLPDRQVAPKKTRKRKSASEEERVSEDETSDQEADEEADTMAPTEEIEGTEEVS